MMVQPQNFVFLRHWAMVEALSTCMLSSYLIHFSLSGTIIKSQRHMYGYMNGQDFPLPSLHPYLSSSPGLSSSFVICNEKMN